MKRISFIVSDGISFPAGIQTAKEITPKVISGEGVMRHTDGNYYFGPPLYVHEGIADETVIQ